MLPYSQDNLARGVPNQSATSNGMTTWVPPRAPDLWGHPPLGVPQLFTCHACNSPLECDPHRSYLSSGSTLCVTPERVIHSTRMNPRNLGFSLTDNWCLVWDPPLVAQLYCLDSRCPISPHCLVARRYILMTDV